MLRSSLFLVLIFLLVDCSAINRRNGQSSPENAKPATPLDMPKDQDAKPGETPTPAPAPVSSEDKLMSTPGQTAAANPAEGPSVTLTHKDGTPVGSGTPVAVIDSKNADAAVDTKTTNSKAAAATAAPAAPDASPSDWGYELLNGPSRWGEIKSEYAACKEGKFQSPINLKWHKPLKDTPLTWKYKAVGAKVEDGSHAVDVTFDQGQVVTYKGRDFDLKSTHFHSPSEHTLSGQQFPMEIHFVHADENGKLVVVAVFVQKGDTNPILEKILKKLSPGSAGEELVMSGKDLMPASHHFYRYSGSLTVPPCTEGVEWFVLNTPIKASEEQIALIRSRHPNNSRPVQSLNERAVINY